MLFLRKLFGIKCSQCGKRIKGETYTLPGVLSAGTKVCVTCYQQIEKNLGKTRSKQKSIGNQLPTKRTAQPEAVERTNSIGILERFDPDVYVKQKRGRGELTMEVSIYRDFVAALTAIPNLNMNDPRLPVLPKKEATSFADMLDQISFDLSQLSYQGVLITVEVHHNLFACISGGRSVYEIAKLNDDAYLSWTFAHDPNEKIEPLFTDQSCTFKLDYDPLYSCKEKAIRISSDRLCLFHVPKEIYRTPNQSMPRSLWDVFWDNYEIRLKELVHSEHSDYRGFQLTSITNPFIKHFFAGQVDLRDSVLDVSFYKCKFGGPVLFDRAVFGSVSFEEAIFKDLASFSAATFRRPEGFYSHNFKSAIFEGYADFSEARFEREQGEYSTGVSVQMVGVKFNGGVQFKGLSDISAIHTNDAELWSVIKSQGTSIFPLNFSCPKCSHNFSDISGEICRLCRQKEALGI